MSQGESLPGRYRRAADLSLSPHRCWTLVGSGRQGPLSWDHPQVVNHRGPIVRKRCQLGGESSWALGGLTREEAFCEL